MKTLNKKIAICVPTCNRALYIKNLLKNALDLYKKYNVDLYIYDSSDNDETNKTVNLWLDKGYDNLFYLKLPPVTFLDTKILKFLQGYGMNETYEYIWPCRDATWFGESTLKRVLENIDKRYDVIALNPGKALSSYYSCKVDKEYTDINEFFNDWGWYMASMDGRLFRRHTLLESADWLYISEKYRVWIPNGTMIEVGFLFEQISKLDSFKALYLTKDISFNMEVSKGGQTFWKKESFDVWGGCWPDTIYRLPDCYTNKEKIIKMVTSIKPHLGSIEILFYLRSVDGLDKKIYEKYKSRWDILSDVPLWQLWIISRIPKIIFIFTYKKNKEQIFKNNLDKYVLNTIPKLDRMLEGNKELILYGAGIVGEKVSSLLRDKYKISCFAVTNIGMNTDELNGYPVYDIQSLLKHKEDSVILIAVVPRLQKEIRKNLIKMGFKNIVYIEKN